MELDADKQNIESSEGIILSSSKSMQVSLKAIRDGRAGLDTHRQSMLNRIPHQGDWAKFGLNTVDLKDLLKTHKLSIIGHSHPGEPIPRPSVEDREALRNIGQSRSSVISAMTGQVADFGTDRFEF